MSKFHLVSGSGNAAKVTHPQVVEEQPKVVPETAFQGRLPGSALEAEAFTGCSVRLRVHTFTLNGQPVAG